MAVIGVEAGENLNHPTLKLIGGEGLVGLSGIDNDGGQVGSEELEDKEYSCKVMTFGEPCKSCKASISRKAD